MFVTQSFWLLKLLVFSIWLALGDLLPVAPWHMRGGRLRLEVDGYICTPRDVAGEQREG